MKNRWLHPVSISEQRSGEKGNPPGQAWGSVLSTIQCDVLKEGRKRESAGILQYTRICGQHFHSFISLHLIIIFFLVIMVKHT